MAYIDPRTNKKGEIISYRIRVSRGYDAEGNRLKPFFMTWIPDKGMTKKQIEAELQRQVVLFEERCNSGTQAVNNKIRMRDFIPQYLETVEVRASPTTLHFYKRVIDTHIIPFFGNKKMQDIKPQHIQNFIKYLTELTPEHRSPTNDTDKLSPSTVRRYLTVLQSIFKTAHKLEIISTNPAKAEKLTIPRVVNPKIEIFTKAEAAEMLNCLTSEDLQFQTYVQLAIITGARRGEMAALKFSDFDYNGFRLTISRAAIKVSGQPIQIKPPKDYEVRTVTVNEHCIELVKMLQAHYEREKQRLGSKWAGDEWLFTQWNGEIMNPQIPTKQFDKFLKKHGLKHRKLHSLRHTSATLLLYGGINIRQVQQRLGHSELETTQKYLHYLSEADVEAVNVLTNMLEPKKDNVIDITA
ncbi:Site-specific recombinase XerD [Ruminococcaceae bacterium FB2012]|nr:Site-specific recombinase XerD [Ruminococcaceae bacterium FB2012]